MEKNVSTWEELSTRLHEYEKVRNNKEEFLLLLGDERSINHKCCICLEQKATEFCQKCNAPLCYACLQNIAESNVAVNENDLMEINIAVCPQCRTRISEL